MTHRRHPAADSLPPPFSFYPAGPVARVVVALLGVGGAVFIAAMAVWSTEDSWLGCTRRVDGTGSCVVRSVYPLGIALEKQLPPIRFARTETHVDHDRYGDHPHEVLLLESLDAPSTEVPGVGKNGARAATVANDVNAFLSGNAASAPPWHLRESAPFGLFVLMAVLAAGMVLLATLGFRRVRLAYDPRTRNVMLRAGRWPLRPKRWSGSIDDIERVEVAKQIAPTGTSYRGQLRLANATSVAELGITSLSPTPVTKVVAAVEAQLAAWRTL